MEKINLDKIIKAAGSQEKLAVSVGLSQQAISRWLKADRVPAEHARKVAEATGIPANKIRPDIFEAPIQEPGQ